MLKRTGLIMALLVAIGACDEKKNEADEEHLNILEAIALDGTCREDHVIDNPENRGAYEGSVAKIKNNDGSDYLFGWLLLKDGLDPKKLMDQAYHPDRYVPANSIEIFMPAGDTTKGHWTIKGTSDRGTEEQQANDARVHGYATTCEVDVTKRGSSFAEVDPNMAKMNKMLEENQGASQ